MIVALLANLASAQDFACPEVFTQAAVDVYLDTAAAAVDVADMKALKEALNQAGPKFRCLDVPADRRSLARYGQLMSVVSFLSQDEEGQVHWGLFAKLIDPDVAWPKSIDAEHPLRVLLSEQELPPTGGPEGKGLAPVKGGAIALNGNWTVEATAYAELPMLVQVYDASAAPTTSYWQDGAAFPDWILGEPNPTWIPPKWTADPAAARGKTHKVARADRAHKDVEIDWQPVLITSGLAVGSGVLFGVAGVMHGGLDDAATGDELKRVRSNTNTMATLGAITGLAAIGYGSVSLFTDGDTLGLSVRW